VVFGRPDSDAVCQIPEIESLDGCLKTRRVAQSVE